MHGLHKICGNGNQVRKRSCSCFRKGARAGSGDAGDYTDSTGITIVITDEEIAPKINATLGEGEEPKKVGDEAQVQFKHVIKEGITEVPEALDVICCEL